MPAYFFDTSALLKRYIEEAGSDWTRTTIASAGEYRYIAQIAAVEVVSAITRLALGKHITARVRDLALAEFRRDYEQGYVITTINPALIQRAMNLAERHALRGYDAMQLAAASFVMNEMAREHMNIIFVCADNVLNKSAAAEGLAVENPNNHA